MIIVHAIRCGFYYKRCHCCPVRSVHMQYRSLYTILLHCRLMHLHICLYSYAHGVMIARAVDITAVTFVACLIVCCNYYRNPVQEI